MSGGGSETVASSTATAPVMRSKAWAEKQPYLGVYAACISTVSPGLTAWQLCRVYSKSVPPHELARMSMRIFPHQTALKALQMNAATPIKEYLNPWFAFGAVGILQGAVYGQCNVHFSRALKLSQTVTLTAGLFRGSAFAGVRDTISQGIPFMCSASVQSSLVDPLLKPDAEAAESTGHTLRRALSVIGTSICATFMSQAAHNCQIRMQADPALSYGRAVSELWAQHGVRVLWMGGSARVLLLLVVNGLNELVLKKAWALEEVRKPALTVSSAASPSMPAVPVALKV